MRLFLNKLLISLIICFFIVSAFSSYALAATNEFTTKLSVSPTQVDAGSQVTSTITVTNKDTTYGADISVSYKGQHIKSFYLTPGQSYSFTHNITINKDTNVYYTVNASHGPDINNTKQTNTVAVTIIKPDTPTPTPTNNTTTTMTPTPTPTPTGTPTATIETTYTPTPSPYETFTPEPSTTTPDYSNRTKDENEGWGAFTERQIPEGKVLDSLYGMNIYKWLGYRNDSITDSTNAIHEESVYIKRRILFFALLFAIVASVAISYVLITKNIKNTNIKNKNI